MASAVRRVNQQVQQRVRTWRSPVDTSTNDTFITAFDYGQYSTVASNRVLLVGDYTHVLVRGFGTGSADEAADIQVLGWMNNSNDGEGSGPGCILAQMRAVLGANSMTATTPTNRGTWTAGTYLETKEWTITGWNGSTGSNACGATELVGGGSSALLIPTLGYSNITMEIAIPGSGGVTTFGTIYHLASAEGVA